MISAQEIKSILETYEKYDWKLRKILLTKNLKNDLKEEDLKRLFGEAEISEAEIDGAFFSRNSKNDKIAWELRHLNANPFAVFELIDREAGAAECVEILKRMENRLENYASNKMSVKGH